MNNQPRHSKARVALRRAGFPFAASMEAFDFGAQASLSRASLAEYLGPELLSQGLCLILCGPTGLGKTHLAIAIATAAVEAGSSALFREAHALFDELSVASRRGRLRAAMELYTETGVLVIDELGYMRHPTSAGELLYQLVRQRDIHGRPVLITTNKPLAIWPEVLHDSDLADAIIDRLLGRGCYLDLSGRSYRTRHLLESPAETATIAATKVASGLPAITFSDIPSDPGSTAALEALGDTVGASTLRSAVPTMPKTVIESPNSSFHELKTIANPDEADPLKGTGLADRYVVEEKLGAGGMGVVYRAREKVGGRLLALKLVLGQGRTADVVARFKREILATAMCDHDNVVEIHDAGETSDGAYFMAMELVAGEDLMTILKREGGLAPQRAIVLLEQILMGLSAIHAAGIVHRDLKPENFRVWHDPLLGLERVKIMDFGIARLVEGRQQFASQLHETMKGFFSGSPAYLAPEAITDPDVDHRADLYSLGITFYQVLSGQQPFVADSAQEYMELHLNTPPPSLHRGYDGNPIDIPLRALIEKLIEKQTQRRYQSAMEVLVDLRAEVRPALGMPDVSAQTPSTVDSQTNSIMSLDPDVTVAMGSSVRLSGFVEKVKAMMQS